MVVSERDVYVKQKPLKKKGGVARIKNPDEIYGISMTSSPSRLFGCSCLFGRDEKPAQSNDDAYASADAQRGRRAYRLQDRTTAKAANKECGNAEHFVITGPYRA